MSKIEIADDSGNECYELTVPIPFYIRVELEESTKRYRISLIDDDGKIRGRYIGTTGRKFLEIHVPVIKLPKPGKLRVLVEESSGESEYKEKHQVSILYLEYIPMKTVDDIQKEPSTTETVEESTDYDFIGRTDQEPKASHIQKEKELTEEEIEYLQKRDKILKEAKKEDETNEIKDEDEEFKLLSSVEEEIKLLSEQRTEEE